MRDLMTVIVCGLLALGIYTYFYGSDFLKSEPKKKVVAINSNAPAIGGGKFKLTNQFGEEVTERALLNSKSLVFFGFTNCPAICPAALSVITEAYIQLGANVEEVKPVFISIDPETDTPQVIQEYLLNYHKDILGLTGPQDEINKVVKSYKAYAGKANDGQVMHSDLIYLMDENGQYMTHFNRENTAEDIVKYIKKNK